MGNKQAKKKKKKKKKESKKKISGKCVKFAHQILLYRLCCMCWENTYSILKLVWKKHGDAYNDVVNLKEIV